MENLLTTWSIFVRGKKHKKDVMEFELNLADNIYKLYLLLNSRSYEHSGYHAFNVSDPKPRNIHKAIVQDRIIHHLLYKELYWYFDSRFIFDSYSCRKNKGTHKALDRFIYFARKVSKNNTRTCYVLKCDIRKFFASIDHSILYKIFERHIEDEEIHVLIKKIVSSFTSGKISVGLPLGNLTSQLFVNIYMHEFDMYVKQELRIKYYIRYADDFVVFSDNKKYLEDVLLKFHDFLNNKLNLKLHEDKVYIKTFSSGVDFLGWVHFPHHRVLRTITKRRLLKNLAKYSKQESINSYKGLLSHGNTYKIRKQTKLTNF